jgi:hypothetical protein
MKMTHERLKIPADKVSPVPDAELARFKRSMTDRVVKPMQERAVLQREQAARVRSRQVR